MYLDVVDGAGVTLKSVFLEELSMPFSFASNCLILFAFSESDKDVFDPAFNAAGIIFLMEPSGSVLGFAKRTIISRPKTSVLLSTLMAFSALFWEVKVTNAYPRGSLLPASVMWYRKSNCDTVPNFSNIFSSWNSVNLWGRLPTHSLMWGEESEVVAWSLGSPMVTTSSHSPCTCT